MLIKRFRWLQIILLALLLGSLPFLAGCGGETADSGDTEPAAISEDGHDDNRGDGANQGSADTGNEELPAKAPAGDIIAEPIETTPTIDTRMLLIRTILTTQAKDANDLYIRGDMVRWREKSALIVNSLTSIGAAQLFESLSTEDYSFFGFRTNEQFVTATQNLFVFSAAMLYESNEPEMATEFIHLVLASGDESNLSLAYSLQGHIYRLEQNDAAAIDSFQTAVGLNSKNANAFLGLGMVEAGISRSNYGLAREYLYQALTINERYGRALAEYGGTYFWEYGGNSLYLERARDYLDDAISADPDNPFAYLLSADLYSFQGNYTKCEVDATNGIERNPQRALAFYFLVRGICRAEAGYDHSANADFDRALQLDPDNEHISNQVASYRNPSSNAPADNNNAPVNEDDYRGYYVDQCPYGYLGNTWFDSSGRLKTEECMSATDFGLSAHHP